MCLFAYVRVCVGMWEQINLQTTPHHWEQINLHTTPHHIRLQQMFFRVKTMTDIHREFFLYSSIVSDIKDLSVKEKMRESESERNSNSATLSVLLKLNFPAVWKENFSLSFPYSDYHHRFLNVSNIVLFLPCS